MELDLGFIVLCPDRDVRGLRSTVSSLSFCYHNADVFCMVDGSTTPKELKQMKEICPTYKGKDTITSLINAGMKKMKKPWAFIIYAGSRIKTNLPRKLEQFVQSEKDILFPIVKNKTGFADGSSNGILIHKDTFKEIGVLPKAQATEDMNDFEVSKLLWECKAIEAGCQFKAIAGIRIC